MNKFVQADTSPDLRQSETIDLPEAEAIRLAQQGDASASECIYRLHIRCAHNLSLRMVGNSTKAEDQEPLLVIPGSSSKGPRRENVSRRVRCGA